MAKDIDVVVISEDLKAAVSHPIPLVKDFFDLACPLFVLALESEAQGPFVSLETGVALDFEGKAHKYGF